LLSPSTEAFLESLNSSEIRHFTGDIGQPTVEMSYLRLFS